MAPYGPGTDWGGIRPTAVRALAFNSLGHVFVGACLSGVLRSTNSGVTWERCLDSADVHTIGIGSQDQIYAGQGFRSTDGGGTWHHVVGPVAPNHVTSFAFGPEGEVFVGTGQDRYVAVEYSFRGVFRSTDSGNGWVTVNEGLRDTCVQSLAFSSDGVLYAGGDMGYGARVHRTTDGGDSWSDVSQGLEGYGVWNLAIDPTGYVYAATSRGVFRSFSPRVVAVSTSAPIVLDCYHLRQNYPNPFNPSTTIKFELPKTSLVRLTVYDILGRQMSVLVNETREAGVHQVKFDGSNLASGIYFYRFQAGEFVSTKRLLLLK